MDSHNLPKSEMWPRDDDFERVLLYLRVPMSETSEIIRIMRLFEPYLLRIGFESDMDFLFLLNSITTSIVKTAPDAREKRADQMIRALCAEEGLVYGYEDSKNEFLDTEDCNTVAATPPQHRHPDCDPTMCSQSALCDLCQSSESEVSELSDVDNVCAALEETVEVIPVGEVQEEVQDLCLALERVNIPVLKEGRVYAETMSPSARRRLRKRRQKEFFERRPPSATRCDPPSRHHRVYVKRPAPSRSSLNQSPPTLPFYTFVSNMADLDWLRSRGVSDKIRLLTERLKQANQS